MPGTVEVSILEAKDLPVMDRASELTDAFVEVSVITCFVFWRYKKIFVEVVQGKPPRRIPRKGWIDDCF